MGRPGRRSIFARRAVAAALAAVSFAAAAALVPGGSGHADTIAVDTFRPEPGPLGPITLIGDSVLLGSALYSPTLDDHLVARGWGPVRFRAAVGVTTGTAGTSTTSTAAYWIERWRAEGWDPGDVMVNLGANDSGICGSNVACARGRITALLDVIGPGHRVWWPKITRFPLFRSQADAWNTALDELAGERDDLFVWDWPTAMYAESLHAGDHTHMTPSGYRRRSELMAHEITADLARARPTGTAATLPAAAGAPATIVPIGPTRILDTRSDPPGRVRAGRRIVVDVAAVVPADATAVAVYVTSTGSADPGYLTAFDCTGERPTASSVNYPSTATRGAVTITPITDGRFCVFSRAETDVVVDVQAAFVPGDGGAAFTPIDTPTRLLDTRDTGRATIHEIDVPSGAEIAAVSLTAIDTGGPGYLTAYPCTADVPVIATVNHGAGEIVSGAAYVPVSPGGTICVFAKADVDVTVDLTGTFSDDGELAFVPVVPTRTIDTRSGVGGWAPLQGQRQRIDAPVAPAQARAVSGTLTMVRPLRNGHLRAWACGVLPETANVTAASGTVLANHVTTAVEGGRLCVYARSATSTVFDTTGWWVPAPM